MQAGGREPRSVCHWLHPWWCGCPDEADALHYGTKHTADFWVREAERIQGKVDPACLQAWLPRPAWWPTDKQQRPQAAWCPCTHVLTQTLYGCCFTSACAVSAGNTWGKEFWETSFSLAKLTHYNPPTPMYSLGDKYRIVYGGGVCDSFKLELS